MRWLVLFLSCLPLTVLAQAPVEEMTVIEPLSPSYLIKLTGGLILVVAVIFILAWLVKRLNLTQHSQNGLLRIVAGLAVGTKDRIVLLQVGEEQILLGLSPGRIEKLHTLCDPIIIEDNIDSITPFAQKLNKLMRKGEAK